MFCLTVPCKSQDSLSAPSTRQEAWPEIDVYYRINEKFRLFGSISATRLRTSSYTDGGLSVNLDYFALPVWRGKTARADSTRGHLLWFRGGFAYATSPPGAEKSFHDYTLVSEASLRFYLPWKLLLTERNRVDWRWRNDDFQPRYRPRLRLERGFKTEFLSFSVYTYGEYFLNFNSDAGTDRLRLAVGWEVRASKRISFDTYYVHQFEGSQDGIGINAIGLQLKFYFHKGDYLFGKKKAKKR